MRPRSSSASTRSACWPPRPLPRPAARGAPGPGRAQALRAPAPKRFTLDNGLVVTLVPYGSVPKVTIELVRAARATSTRRPGEVWLADLTGKLHARGHDDPQRGARSRTRPPAWAAAST